MHIRQAVKADLETVKGITHETIKAIYPRYYPAGAVDLFLAHHSAERIAADIALGAVFIAVAEEEAVGTVTIKNIEICRLFVLPQHQGKGYGKALMEYAENAIFQKSTRIRLDASLPAKGIYLKHGYQSLEYHRIPADNGDYLCYDVMEKSLGRENG